MQKRFTSESKMAEIYSLNSVWDDRESSALVIKNQCSMVTFTYYFCTYYFGFITNLKQLTLLILKIIIWHWYHRLFWRYDGIDSLNLPNHSFYALKGLNLCSSISIFKFLGYKIQLSSFIAAVHQFGKRQ